MSVPPRIQASGSATRLRWYFLAALALLPVVYMAVRSFSASRNLAYVDDIDGPLMLLMRLDGGWLWSELREWMFEVANEHRMVTSRILVLVSYWLTGTVNFHVMGLIGNLFICALCYLLVRTAGTTERRWGMALLLAGLIFQLQHFENFFWSGSSIDHFQVPLLAGAAIVLLARGSALATGGAVFLAVMATYTLAHGLMVWPVGALMLAVDRRWRQLGMWLGFGAATAALFLWTFQSNSAHQIEILSWHRIVRTFTYWLELIGAPLALGEKTPAILLGGGFVVLLGWQLKSVGFSRERITLPLAVWAVGSLGLVAFGRANLGDGLLSSRYYILGGLAWVAIILVELQRRQDPARPYRFLTWLVPALVVFNVAANLKFDRVARKWTADRDLAAASFVKHGRDGMAAATLHPLPLHATRVIREAERLGVYALPRQSEERTFSSIRTETRLASAVDRVSVDDYLVVVEGWAAIPGRVAQAGDVHLVLSTADSRRILTTATVARPDVAAAFPGEKWGGSGFRFELRRWLLPAEDFQIGLLIPTERGAEMVMTGKRLELGGDAVTLEKDKVAPSRIVFDEVVVRSAVTRVMAAPKKPVRLSFLDLRHNLVFVDLIGAGTLTLNLADLRSLPVASKNGIRKIVSVQGHASISIEGADETTHLAIMAARRPLPSGTGGPFHRMRDGIAHVASVSISSRNGKFGSIRTGNAEYSAREGIAGVDAPGVRFIGPVNLGDIQAYGEARPVLKLGMSRDTRVVGGGLLQPNGRPVEISGVPRLRFVEGRTAFGVRLLAHPNSGQLLSSGRNVSGEVAPGGGISDD